MLEFDGFICVAKPRRIPTLDTGDLPLDRSDTAPAICVAPVGGCLQERGEFVGGVGHALSDPGGHSTTLHPPLQEPATFRFAPVGSFIPFVGQAVALVGPVVTLVGPSPAVFGEAITPIGAGLTLVSDAVAAVGSGLALVGHTIALIGRGVAPIRGTSTLV